MRREARTLAETQSALFSLITGRRPAGASPPDPEAWVVGDVRAGAAERVALYAFMVRYRLVEALETQFPRLATLLGAERFAELADAYFEAHPSTHPSLRFSGAHLADWIGHCHPEMTAADLARLEWARVDVFDAADETTLGLDAIRAWPRGRFAELPVALTAAHRLLETAAGTAELWRRIGDGKADDGTEAPSGRETILVWRHDVSVYHRTVDAAEREALECAAKGTHLARICETADAAGRAFAWLWAWASEGLLACPAGQPR